MSSECGKRFSYQHGATVTKLPDTKPLKLVGCYTPWTKKSLVRQIGARGISTLLGHFYTVITTL